MAPLHAAALTRARRHALASCVVNALLVVAILFPLATEAPAQPAADAVRESTTGRYDGRDFAGLTLPAPPQTYAVSVRGSRAWAWSDRGTNRLLLDRDVRVTIGPHAMSADRAVLWAEPVEVDGKRGDQIAVYLENIRDPGAAAGFAQQGERLLVTAIIVDSPISLRADVVARARPEGDDFLMEAEARLSRYLAEITEQPETGIRPAQPAPPGTARRTEAPGRPQFPGWIIPPDDRGSLPPAERSPVIEPKQGVVTVAADRVESVEAGNDGERSVIFSGGVAVQYQLVSPARTMQLSAERAVVFHKSADNGPMSRFEVGDVSGVYLEGDVQITDGRYTLRGSRVFYDIARDRAIVLDAVFWTYDEEKGMPLYLRAAAIRQESRNQWSGRKVRLANVGFAEPHFSVGADTITLTRETSPSGRDRQIIDAHGVGFLVGETPVFGLPHVQGEYRPSILRRLTVGTEAGDPIVRTAWDLYSILGLDAREGNEAELLLDGYFDRGVGVGTDVKWADEDAVGGAFGYFIHDSGTDRLTSGAHIDHDDDNRGMFLAEQRWNVAEHWTVFLEGSYISDETFVDAFYERLAETRREFTNSVYARRLEGNSLLSIEARGTFNDFISNEYLLQSRGYVTEKLPEIVYSRVADDLFGIFSYSSDTSYSRVDLKFSKPQLRQLGFDTPDRAGAGFGLAPTDSLETVLKAQGYTGTAINRFDTRHDIEMPLAAGALNIVPFATGRFTAWDDSFDNFSIEDHDSYRLWGGGGVRMFTTIQHIDDSIESRFFDLHRIRHLIEPNATVWSAATSVDQRDLPVYDEEVESIAAGSALRGGVRNTWQTMRGGRGPGADERSVDWLVINTDYIWSSSEVDIESPFGRFIEAQPERSFLGDFFSNEVLWNFTDTVALTNDVLIDAETGEFARTTVGGIFDHGYGFSSMVEWRDLPPLSATYLNFGAKYEFTRKYGASAFAVYDLTEGQIQSVGFTVTRRFPQWTVGISLSYDNITDDTSVGVTLRPAGIGNENRSRAFMSDPLASDAAERHGAPASPRPGRLDYGPFEER